MANRINYTIGFNADSNSLNQLKIQLNNLIGITQKELKLFNPSATQAQLKQMQADVQAAASTMGRALETAYNPKLNTINITKFNQSLNTSKMTVQQMEVAFSKAGTQGKNAFLQMTSQILTTQRAVKQTSNFLDSMSKTFVNTIKWSVASSVIQGFTSSIRNAWSYTQRLDESLNNIRIVTGQSAEEMDKFAKKANSAAKSLGASTTAYTNAALIYYQQGLEGEDVTKRAEVTVKAANVTGQSAAEVSEQLTAVWNGYKVVADEAENYVDKLAAVAASTAADLEELSEGMSKVASAASTMGVDIDQLSAALSTVVSVTRQDAAAVGTAFKTIFARMGDLQVDGVDEFGVSLGDVSGKLKQVGIDVLDQQGNLRDMGTVITEVAGKWKNWTGAQQQAIAVAMAGKRQYNNLIALFENWDMYESALTTSQNAEGTLQKQQDIYMDSLEGRLNQLKTAGEGVYDAIFDSESMKTFLKLLTGAVESVDNFITGIGGGGNLLLMLGSTATSVFSNQIAGGIARVISNFGIWREGIEQTKAELEITTKYTNLQSEAAQKLVNMKAQGLKYGKLMSQEESKELDQLIEQTAQLEMQKNLEEERIKNNEEFAKRFLKGQENIVNDSNRGSFVKKFNERAKELEARADIQDASSLEPEYQVNIAKRSLLGIGVNEQEANRLSNLPDRASIIEEKDALKTQKANTTDADEIALLKSKIEILNQLEAAQGKYGTATSRMTTAIQELLKDENLSEESKKRLNGLLDKNNKLTIKTSEAQKVLKEETKKLSQEYQKQGKQFAVGNKELKKTQEGLKKATAATKSFFKQINTKAMVSGIVQGVSALGQLGSAIISVSNMGDIWADESTTKFEKIAQTLSAVGMTASTLTMSISGLGKGISMVSTALGLQNTLWGVNRAIIKETDIEKKKALLTEYLLNNSKKLFNQEITKENAKTLANKLITEQSGNAKTKLTTKNIIAAASETVLGEATEKTGDKAKKAWYKILGPIGWIIAGVTLLTSLVIGIAAAFDAFDDSSNAAVKKAQEELDKAREAAQGFQETVKDTKEAYATLLDEISKYRDAQTALTKLKEGTEEWELAVIELNQQVLDLLSKYEELARYIKVGDNGVLEIKQEGFDQIVSQQQNEIKKAELKNIAGQATVLEKKTSLEQAQIKDIVKGNIKKDAAESGWGMGVSMTASGAVLGTMIMPGIGTAIGAGVGAIVGAIVGPLTKNAVETSKDKAAEYVSSDEFTEGLSQQRKENPDLFANTLNQDGSVNTNSKLYQYLEAQIENQDLGVETEELVLAMVKNSDALEESVEALEAQKEATEALNKSYLQTFADKYGIKDIETFTNVSANDLGTGDLDYSQYTKNYSFSGYKGGEHIGNKINTSNDRKGASSEAISWVKKAYGEDVKYSGLDADNFKDIKNLDDFKDATFQVDTNGDGETEEVSGQDIINAAAQKDVENAIKEKTQTNANIINALAEGKKNTQLAYFMGDNSAEEWKNKTLSDAAALKAEAEKGGIVSYVDATTGKTVSVDLATLVTSIEETRSQMEDAISETMSTIGQREGWSSSSFSNFTKTDLFAFEKNIASAALIGGDAAKEALLGAFDDFAEDPVAMEKLNELATNVDWANTTSIDAFVASAAELGYQIDTTDASWQIFMDNARNGLKQWVNNSQKVIEKLKTIKEIAADISFGDIISDEDYKKIFAINPEIAKDFIKTADGYKALENGATIEEKLSKQFDSLSGVKTYYDDLISAGKSFDYNKNLDLNKSTDAVNYINSLLTNESSAEKLFENSNYTLEAIKNARDIVTKEGVDTSSSEYQAALELLQNAGTKVNTTIGEIEAGLIGSTTAQEYWVTEGADSWSEIAGADLDADVREKAERYWSNRYYTEMGIESTTLLEDLGMDELEKQVKRFRKLNLDYYTEINNNIEKLGEQIDLAFGQNKLNKIQELNTEQEKYLTIAEGRLADARANEKNFNAALVDFGLKPNEATLEDIRNKQSEYDKESEEYKNLQTIIEARELVDEIEAEVRSAVENIADNYLNYFDTNLQIHLDLEEAEVEWNEFKANYLDRDVSILDDLSGSESYTLAKENYDTYEDTLDEYLNSLKASGFFSADGKFMTDLGKEKFSELFEGGQEAFENMVDQAKEMQEAYISIQEEILEAYDKQIERLSNINSLYSSSADLVKLIGRNLEGYGDKVSEYYANITTNAVAAQTVANAQLAAAKKAFDDDYEKASEEQKKLLEENLNTATANAIEKAQEAADAMSQQFSEALTLAIDNAFGGSGLQGFTEEWQRELYLDERYLDDVNSAYATDELKRKIQSSIDQTDSITAQNKLNKLMQQELDILSKRDKLTQADFDRANARYELALKQIALEEAQQTASKMKLVRDASGNYTYQYVADQDAVAKVEAEVAKAENDLYNLNKDQEKETIDLLTSKYQEAIEAIGRATTKDERDALNDYYFGSDGVITNLEKDLTAIEESGGLTGTYDSASYRKTIDRLLAIEPEDIGNEIAELNATFSGQMETLTGSLNELLGEDGAIVAAIKDLESKAFSGDSVIIPDASGLLTSASNILAVLNDTTDKNGNVVSEGLLSKLNNYALQLSKFADKQIAALTSDVVEKNTDAVNALTAAMYYHADMLDGAFDKKVDDQNYTITKNDSGLLDISIGTENS